MVAGRVQFYSMLNLNNFMMIQEVELFVHVLHQGQDKSSNNTNTPLKISGMKYSCLNYTELNNNTYFIKYMNLKSVYLEY